MCVFGQTSPPTKASPAPFVSTMALWSMSTTGNVVTLSPVVGNRGQRFLNSLLSLPQHVKLFTLPCLRGYIVICRETFRSLKVMCFSIKSGDTDKVCCCYQEVNYCKHYIFLSNTNTSLCVLTGRQYIFWNLTSIRPFILNKHFHTMKLSVRLDVLLESCLSTRLSSPSARATRGTRSS